jgi:hypothetical protein
LDGFCIFQQILDFVTDRLFVTLEYTTSFYAILEHHDGCHLFNKIENVVLLTEIWREKNLLCKEGFRTSNSSYTNVIGGLLKNWVGKF